ncbi:MAG: class I SAM-dependent RNA methyltransferase [Hyphomicrobium sp.]|nr:class I SAM-dependent RNA methyltransferase [Hyphomicrobium sp.]PPD08925.1 MAG: (uracil-5)-methyltransferase [Hyphomicrobium sp.]
MADATEVTIEKLGGKGDGIARTPAGDRFIAGALPGERWQLNPDGPPQRLSDSPGRAIPPCPHYGVCGGCMSQHMSQPLYLDWKHQIVRDAFHHRGITAEIAPVLPMPLRSRRRAFLGIERSGGDVWIGFREEGQHTLVDITDCLLLDPAIMAAFPHLKAMAKIAMPGNSSGRLIVTKLDTGLDVSFDNGHKLLQPDERARLAQLAETARIARLVVAGDAIVVRSEPRLTLGTAEVDVPPSLFLQAIPEAERRMIDLVVAALPKKAKRVADLFSGLGTFTFPLAAKVQVTAFDSDRRAISVLEAAARRATGLKPIEARVRDLFREPLSPKELETYDAVVLDPPRAGAAEQAERLARSKVPVVIAVSCAPATLARDARTLIDAGFKMGPVTPIDQFIFSPHIEAVTVFKR